MFAAVGLKRAQVEVTLLDRRNFHLFQPLLYQVATGGLSPADIAYPLRSLLSRQRNTQVLQAEVLELDVKRRRVVLRGGEVFYDTLIVAAGARHDYFGHDGWEPHAPGLKTIEDATAMRGSILGAFERAELEQNPVEREALLTFVVVGGGPTGVELAGAIGELSRHTLKHDFRTFHPSSTRILLVEGIDRVLPSFPARLSAAARRSLERLGVEVLTDTRVSDIDAAGVTLTHGDEQRRVRAATVLWAAGVHTSHLAGVLVRETGIEADRAGRLKVATDCTVPGHPEIFVIGDMVHLQQDGEMLPGVAPVAIQQGRYASRLIRARLGRRAVPRPFRYRNRGTLAVIGRASAVADLPGRLHFSGYPAWLFWLFVHIMLLVGFENRILVFVQWAFSYITRNRGARLITGQADF